MSCRNTSVSDVDWKIAPSLTNCSRMARALVRLPLWAMAKPPEDKSAKSG